MTDPVDSQRDVVGQTYRASIDEAVIVDGKWKEAWYFADELGLLLQLDAVDAVLGS